MQCGSIVWSIVGGRCPPLHFNERMVAVQPQYGRIERALAGSVDVRIARHCPKD